MQKLIILIGLSLLLIMVFCFSKILCEIMGTEGIQSGSLSQREIYVSETIVTVLWGDKESQIKQEHIPSSFGVSPDGDYIFVLDRYKKRIIVFNYKGELVREINTPLSNSDRMGSTIQDIAIDGENGIYFTGYSSLYETHIRKIDFSGRKIFEISVPHNILGVNIMISNNVVYYGNLKENMAVYDVNKQKGLKLSLSGVETSSYFVDGISGTIKSRKGLRVLDDIYLDNMAPRQVLGEDIYGNLYIQYGHYIRNLMPGTDYKFLVRKFDRTGNIVAEIDLRKIYDNELIEASSVSRIVNIDNHGSIYQLYADSDNGVQIIKYSPNN